MFTGVITALVTPFRNGAVDEEALRRLVDEQIAAGIDGLVPVGTTGESPTLDHEEHLRVIQIVVAAGQQARAGHRRHRRQQHPRGHRAVEARPARLGADGMLQVTPYYNKPTQDGLYRHFKAIVEAAPLPTIVYNVPGRTGCDLLPETVARLCDIKEVVAHQGGHRQPAAGLADHRPGRRSPGGALGRRRHRLPAVRGRRARRDLRGLQRGAGRTSPACGTPSPPAIWPEARELHYRCFPLSEGLFIEANPIPVKSALAMMGKIADEIRPPLYPMSRRQQGEGPQDPARPGPGHAAEPSMSAAWLRLCASPSWARPARWVGPSCARSPRAAAWHLRRRHGTAGQRASWAATPACWRAWAPTRVTVRARAAQPPGEADVWIDFSSPPPPWTTPRPRPSGRRPGAWAPPACTRTTGRTDRRGRPARSPWCCRPTCRWA